MNSSEPEIAQFLSSFPSDIQALVHLLRKVVHQAFPDVNEAVYKGWRLIGYRTPGPKRGRYFAYIAPDPAEVQLGFEWGVLMADPHHLLGGNGKQVRTIKINAAENVRPRLLVPYFHEAARVAHLSRDEKANLLLQREAEEAELT